MSENDGGRLRESEAESSAEIRARCRAWPGRSRTRPERRNRHLLDCGCTEQPGVALCGSEISKTPKRLSAKTSTTALITTTKYGLVNWNAQVI